MLRGIYLALDEFSHRPESHIRCYGTNAWENWLRQSQVITSSFMPLLIDGPENRHHTPRQSVAVELRGSDVHRRQQHN